MKDNALIIVLVVLVLGVTVAVGYFFLTEDREQVIIPETPPTTTYEENFKFSAEYLEDSTWEYSITGYLPNPCFNYQLDTTVMESFPEQVVVSMEITENVDKMCAQVIQDVEETGTFKASEEAIVSFEVI